MKKEPTIDELYSALDELGFEYEHADSHEGLEVVNFLVSPTTDDNEESEVDPEEDDGENYDNVLDKVYKAIDGENPDDIIPALVTALCTIMRFREVPKTVLLSFIADAFDDVEKRKAKK